MSFSLIPPQPLFAAEQAENLPEGIRIAEISIDRGAATEKMEELIRYTRENV